MLHITGVLVIVSIVHQDFQAMFITQLYKHVLDWSCGYKISAQGILNERHNIMDFLIEVLLVLVGKAYVSLPAVWQWITLLYVCIHSVERTQPNCSLGSVYIQWHTKICRTAHMLPKTDFGPLVWFYMCLHMHTHMRAHLHAHTHTHVSKPCCSFI